MKSSDFLSVLRLAPARVENIHGATGDTAQVRVDRTWRGSRCSTSLTNAGKEPVRLKNVILFDVAKHGLDPATPVYGEGFQKLAQTCGSLQNPAYRGAYPDAKHYRIAEPDGQPTVYGMITFDLGVGDQVLLGFISCNRFIGRFSFDENTLRISIDPEGLELAPGESWKLEEFIAVAGPDRNELLDLLVAGINGNHPPLPQPPIGDRAGWCTWYGVGGAGNQKIVTESAERFSAVLPELRFIQIDEGYTLEGDLLGVCAEFGDMQETLKAIRASNFLPAIWVGPFVAAQQSRTLAEHPGWFVQGSDGKPLVSDTVGFGGWKNGPWCALDGSNPEAQEHLENVFRTMREKWGVSYFKLDANYWGAIHSGRHYDPGATRVEAYRRGMEAVVRGAGPGAVILGCNAPMWPSLGLVNAMRTSNDIQRDWGSIRDTARENLLRGWQNGTLWVTDPDCAVLGGKMRGETGEPMPENIRLLHATVIHAVGGLVLSGDTIADLGPEQISILRKLIPPTGRSARFEDTTFEVGMTDLGNRQYYYAFNWNDHPVDRILRLKHFSGLKDYWTGEDLGVHDGNYELADMPARSARLILAVPAHG